MIVLVVAILVVLLLASELRGWLDRRSARQREAALLDRVMAKSYGEFAAFDQAKVVQVASPAERRTLVDDTGLIEVDAEDDENTY